VSELSRSVVVVGAGPGLGASLARRFAREGYRPVLLARDPHRLVDADLDAAGAVRLAADAADPAALRTALAAAVAEVGDPEVLLFNPSPTVEAPPSEVSPDDVLMGLRVVAVGAVVTTQAVLPAMLSAGHGSLLFTGSGAALRPWAPMVAVAMQKAALRAYVLALADEVAPRGVHAGLVTVQGVLGSRPELAPDAVAEHFWAAHSSPPEQWRADVQVTG
jgi:NAD(P)-dependent dehydrogenase (short-subunit alcohol dehydrogenase family)